MVFDDDSAHLAAAKHTLIALLRQIRVQGTCGLWLPLISFILYADGMKASELISPVYYASAFGFLPRVLAGKGFLHEG